MAACPSCGFENAESAKFCSECGSRLDVSSTPQREERKVVTVVFADLVGSTARADQLDPEDVRAVLAPYHDRLRGELERHGGTVEKFIGDAVVGVFGAPVAHEDDPERGVRAALAIHEAIAELNEADPRLELEVRIGVHTGEALVSLGARPELGEAMVAGDVMNTAARLQSAAPPGGILVSEATHRGTDRAIEYDEAEPVTAKGKQAPIPVWRALAPRSGFGLDIGGAGRAPLVGRERELDVLLNALERARAAREPQLVTLVGVPGIGKSRLVYELYRTVEADQELITWRQGRSLPYGEGVAFWALGEIVKGQGGIHETDDENAAAEKLALAVRDLVSDEGEASWVERHLRTVVGLAGETSSGEGARDAAAAWRRFVEALAESRPTVLVFEDLHWADDGLLDFVDELVDWARDVPLLVVGTARPELLERRPGWGGGKRNAATLSLAPLTDDDTARLVGALLERSLLPAETQAELLAHAGGNPLYAEEFARMHAVGGGARVPDSLQAIVAARIDSLPADEKSLLQVASMLGKVFWTGALAALGASDGDELDVRLRALERKEFVRRERRSAMAGEEQYAFLHALIRDVAYGQLPRPERVERHVRAAEWIEGLARADDHADLVAHHFGAALSLATAAALPTTPFQERARHAFKRAGDRATRLAAFSAAIGHYRAAADLWPEDADGRADVLLGLGRALVFIEQRGEKELGEARELYAAAGDLEGAAEAERELSRLAWLNGDTGRSDEHLARAVTLLDGSPPSRVKAEVLLGVSGRHMLTEEFEEAIVVGEQALAIAEAVGDADARAGAMLNIGASQIRAVDWEDGISLMREATEFARESRSWQLIRGLGQLRDALFEHGDLEEAARLGAQGLDEARRAGHTAPAAWLTGELAHDLYHAGAWDQALEALESEFFFEGGHAQWFEAAAYQLRGTVRLARGERALAARDAERGLELARDARDQQMVHPALAFSATVQLELGNTSAAAEHADELLASWSARAGQDVRASWVVDLSLVLLRLGRGREFVTALTPVAGYSRWVEASLALADGRALVAAEIFAQMGSRPCTAAAQFEAGRALVAEGRRADASPPLEQAARFWRSVGATAYLNQTEELRAVAS
jgi:class 3 adenylate cyclase/tetratricopeptide (TPR) repeat protein